MLPDSLIAEAAAILQAGGLVAFPTETVYGLGANALDEQAVARVFDVKKRPRFDPLIVHVANVEGALRLAADFPTVARRLAEKFWPGPLTLVLPKRTVVPDLVTAGCSTVALRIPDHPVAQALLRAANLPVAAPSANPFGQISPTTAEHVRAQLGQAIDLILDGGPCRVGVESTVLQLTNDVPLLLRPGGTTLEEIEAVIGAVKVLAAGHADLPQRGLASPGTLLQHYAPRTPLVLRTPATAGGSEWVAADSLLKKGTSSGREPPIFAEDSQPQAAWPQFQTTAAGVRQGLLAFQESDTSGKFVQVEILSPTGNLREAAANFFAALRRLDAAGLDLIVADIFPEVGLGRALNDRLRRASHS